MAATMAYEKDACCCVEGLAKFFGAVIAAEVPVHLVSSWKPGVVAAAYALGARAGLGGWWLPSSLPLCPENICYFSIPLQPSDLPAWFLCEGKEDLQKYICALEALAQLVLLACQLQSDEQVDSGWIALRQLSDNMGVVGACTKALSMRSPLTEVLQSLGLFSARHQTLNVGPVKTLVQIPVKLKMSSEFLVAEQNAVNPSINNFDDIEASLDQAMEEFEMIPDTFNSDELAENLYMYKNYVFGNLFQTSVYLMFSQ